MIYSDVIENNLHLILKKKKRYNTKDVKKILSNSDYTLKQAIFIVKCTAIFHEVDFSKNINKLLLE